MLPCFASPVFLVFGAAAAETNTRKREEEREQPARSRTLRAGLEGTVAFVGFWPLFCGRLHFFVALNGSKSQPDATQR